jgi:hypothetical protein
MTHTQAGILAIGVALIAWGSCGCASDRCDARHPDTFALLAECRLRVARECPTLKRGECKLGEPCPQCRAVEFCDQETRNACLPQ